ncbi:unnamed protein product [Dimorphilus gyrociliatus]|uniref:BZIP domain-containing protein n=1 Tax=Dimorphilus gyrociliatus TaxID=2664684 RepID=A0A7I8WAD8_9ANNE|nr:unnamed protein product [Dimorphilus gyrociliatus]
MNSVIADIVDIYSLPDFGPGCFELSDDEIIDSDFLTDISLSPLDVDQIDNMKQEAVEEEEDEEEEENEDVVEIKVEEIKEAIKKSTTKRKRQRKRACKGTPEYILERKKNNDSVRRSRMKKKVQEQEKDEEIIRLRRRVDILESVIKICGSCTKLVELKSKFNNL